MASSLELGHLAGHLLQGEEVARIVGGTCGGGIGILVLTDRRVIFLRDGWTGQTFEDFPLEKVSSVQWTAGVMSGTLTIFTSGNKSAVTHMDKDTGKALADDVRATISGPGRPPRPRRGRRLHNLRLPSPRTRCLCWNGSPSCTLWVC